jgi:NADH dehydrogenase FAD-containing subunit
MPGAQEHREFDGNAQPDVLAFEQAESEGAKAEREAWLTFVVVGGGLRQTMMSTMSTP